MRKSYCIYWCLFLLLVSCAKNESAVTSDVGKGGSLAKFTIAGNYVYAIDSRFLYSIDISNPAAPVQMSQIKLNFDIETIYPYQDKLFIGSRTGMFVYSIEKPSTPKLIGQVSHVRSCDPVVANDSASYSTIKAGTACGPATSGLYVYDLRKSSNPELKKTIPINEPVGLGIADSALYVCGGTAGLKVYSISNAYEPVEIKNITGYNFVDVIPYGNLLICWTVEGITLYDINKRLQPTLITSIAN